MNTLEDLLLMGYEPSGANALAPAKPYMPMKTFKVNGKEYFIPGSEPMGTMQPAPGADPRYQPPPASETWKRAVSMGADFVPILGDIKSGQEAITGKDLLTGEKYAWWERVLAGAGALPFIPNVAGQIKAFHGSPYKFDKFKAEKIGTGEGAQAFGHGLYFTSEKEIANTYAKAVAPDKFRGKVIKDEMMRIQEQLDKLPVNSKEWNMLLEKAEVFEDIGIGKTKEQLTRKFDNMGYHEETRNLIRSIKDNEVAEKSVYNVTLHKGKEPGEYDYLKWDEALSQEQIFKIEEQAKKEGLTLVANTFWNKQKAMPRTDRLPLENVEKAYRRLSEKLGSDREASAFLLRAGIDGIEYPAGSLSGGTKKGAKNYVVFDENAITIDSPKAPVGKVGLISEISSLVNKETGGLTRGMDYVADLAKSRSKDELIETLRWTRSEEVSPWIRRFVGDEIASQLRQKGVPVDEIKWQLKNLKTK